MPYRNTNTSYGSVSKALHWVIGTTIMALLAVGLYMTEMPASPDKWQLYGLHKATGIIVLALVLVRLGWRVANPAPSLPAQMPSWQRLSARLSHCLLYVAMLVMPLSGWMMSSAGGHPVSLYGLVELPALVDKNPAYSQIAREIHEYAGLILIVMISLHVAAALYHHFIRKDDVFKRMLP